MSVCSVSIEKALTPGLGKLFFGQLLGLCGVLGWGALFERFFGELKTATGILHAFLVGTVLVSALMMLASFLGVPFAWLGVGVVGTLFSFHFRKEIVTSIRVLTSDLSKGWIALILALPLAFQIAALPLWFSDATSIWSYHGKVLVCESLLSSHYINEKFWTGTHPEYPLFLPLLYSYFFSWTDSFRDDCVKIWQAISFLFCLGVVYRQLSLRGLAQWIIVVMLLGLEATLSLDVEGKIELNCIVFFTLLSVCAVSRDFRHIPVYLFGLAFCKNEGLAASLVFIATMAILQWVRTKKVRVELGMGLAGIALVVILLSSLPSNHEQYPSHFLSIVAWKSGLLHVGEIVRGCAKIWAHWGMGAAFLGLLLSSPFSFFLLRKDGESLVVHLWSWIMIAVFLAVYLVTPWGPKLYANTFDRLLAEVFPAAVIAFGLWVSSARGKSATLFAYVLVIVLSFVSLRQIWIKDIQFFSLYRQALTNGQVGWGAYKASPIWQRALKLEKALPLNGAGNVRGVALGENPYFDLNYTLYPKLAYAADPQEIAGTYLPWEAWTSIDEADLKKNGFSFVIQGERVLIGKAD